MDDQVTCEYCSYFAGSKIIQKKVDENDPKNKKKKKEPILKRCSASRKKINIDSPSCEFFNPSEYFHCIKNSCRIAVIQCMNRRKNDKGFKEYDDCLKCRQFERTIKHIAEEFWIKARKPVQPKKSIRRREKKESKITRRRAKPSNKIKRREKPTKTRITRRDRPVSKRKIKRRTK